MEYEFESVFGSIDIINSFILSVKEEISKENLTEHEKKCLIENILEIVEKELKLNNWQHNLTPNNNKTTIEGELFGFVDIGSHIQGQLKSSIVSKSNKSPKKLKNLYFLFDKEENKDKRIT